MTANLEAAWTQTTLEWTSPAAHAELFRLVHLHDAWLWAARSYREYAKAHTGDEIAQRQLKKLQGYLMITLAPREKPVRNPYRATISILVMMMLALGAGAAFTKLAGNNPAPDSEWESGLAVAPEPAAPALAAPDQIVQTLEDSTVVATTR